MSVTRSTRKTAQPSRADIALPRGFSKELIGFGLPLLRDFLNHPRPSEPWPETYLRDRSGSGEPSSSRELDHLQRDCRWFIRGVDQWSRLSPKRRKERTGGADPLPWPNTVNVTMEWNLDKDGAAHLVLPPLPLDQYLWCVIMESRRRSLWSRHLRICRYEPCSRIFENMRERYCSDACRKRARRAENTSLGGKEEAAARARMYRANKARRDLIARRDANLRRYGKRIREWPENEAEWYYRNASRLDALK